LVVDDSEAMRYVQTLNLRQAGCAVFQAGDGIEALEIYRQHGPAIDLVLLDVCMPRLDGPGTLRALRELNPGIRCVFITGGSPRYSKEDLLALHPAGLFWKPCRAADVVRMLHLDNVPPAAAEQR
jgi:CheY-like chemotaxis protein